MPDYVPPRTRVAFISPCGWGNLGDAAIIDSLIHGLRSRAPRATIEGFTLNPADTAWRHGITAGTISSLPMPFYPIRFGDGGTPPPAETLSTPTAETNRLGNAVRTTVRRLPVARSAASLLLAGARMPRERASLREERKRLAGTEAIVVAGGGQLDALFGGLFGQPYALWRWALLSRQLGAKLLVLSVGTGTLGPADRWLLLRSLRHAQYRSFRDETSRALLGAPDLTASDPIVPDLAYALPREADPVRADSKVVAGVSPMNYQHPEFYPHGRLWKYEAHLHAMFFVCKRLLDAGGEVVLFTTDGSDEVGLRDLLGRIDTLAPSARRRVTVAECATVATLWETYGRVDIVVASRLHGALLAHVAGRPALALAHERKVRTMMADVGHSEYCFDMLALDHEAAVAQLDRLIAERVALSRDIRIAAHELRRRVEAQYDTVFGPIV